MTLRNTIIFIFVCFSIFLLKSAVLAFEGERGVSPQRRPAGVSVTKPAPSTAGKMYFVEAFVGGGATSEYVTTGYGKAGVKGRYYLSKDLNLGFGVSDAVYDQMYIVIRQDIRKLLTYGQTVDFAPIWLTEQKIDAETHVRYRIPVGRSALNMYPLAGLKGIFLQNGVFNFSMGGIHAGAELGYALVGALSLEAEGDFLYNLAGGQPTASLFGSPWAAATYGVSLGYRLTPEYRLKAGYDGQTIFFDQVRRVYNGLVVSFIF